MAERDPQNFANHRRIVPLYHVGTFGILAINLIWRLVQLVRWPSWPAVARAAHGRRRCWDSSSTLRIFALTVQDRVIRLEMRLRLKEILPPDLKGRIDELTRDQFVALRFASDAEMPDLDARGPDEEHQEPRGDQAPRQELGPRLPAVLARRSRCADLADGSARAPAAGRRTHCSLLTGRPALSAQSSGIRGRGSTARPSRRLGGSGRRTRRSRRRSRPEDALDAVEREEDRRREEVGDVSRARSRAASPRSPRARGPAP